MYVFASVYARARLRARARARAIRNPPFSLFLSAVHIVGVHKVFNSLSLPHTYKQSPSPAHSLTFICI